MARKTGIMYLKKDEADAFFAVINSKRDRMIFLIMYRMGLRVGEVVGTKEDYWTKNGKKMPLKDVPARAKQDAKVNKAFNFEGNTYIHTNNSLEGIYIEDIDWDEKTITVRGKGRKTRIIPMHKDVIFELMDYVRPFDPDQPKTGKLFDIEAPMVRNRCREYAKKAGIDRAIHPHMFRHTFAVNFLKVPDNKIHTLQAILGHTSLATTSKYLQVLPEDVREAIDRVGMQEAMHKDPVRAKKDMVDAIMRILE